MSGKESGYHKSAIAAAFIAAAAILAAEPAFGAQQWHQKKYSSSTLYPKPTGPSMTSEYTKYQDLDGDGNVGWNDRKLMERMRTSKKEKTGAKEITVKRVRMDADNDGSVTEAEIDRFIRE